MTTKAVEKENNLLSLNEEVEVHPFEGAYALSNFLKEKGLKTKPIASAGMFGTLSPPASHSIETAPGVMDTFIWGNIEVDTIDGYIKTKWAQKNNRPIFVLGGEVNQIHKHWSEAFAKEFRDYVKANSLYKGKAIRLRADDKDAHTPNFFAVPTFIDTALTKDGEFILDADLEEQINTTLFAPIKNSVRCRELGISLKRGVLLEGPYGTGKTLTARATAKLAVENGWTFILVDSAKNFKEAFEFAEYYAPAVIFAEDIDSSVQGEDRTDTMNDVLNTIDGIKAKNSEVLMVMTTNDVSTINKAMMRPGRIDSVVTFRKPSPAVRERLVRFYAKDLLAAEMDLTLVVEALHGHIPAMIREVVERTKLRLVANGAASSITSDDLIETIAGMGNHFALINPKAPEPLPLNEDPRYRLGEALAEVVKQSFDSNPLKTQLEDVHTDVTHILHAL